MKSNEIRKKYLDFFKTKDHAVIPSAPLVPENDPTVLFNTAGMQPLVPYLMGEKHPLGKRLVNYQKCLRTVEIDEDNSIGDKTHHTFFEMLGNWSLGDYFKKESIEWSFEFLTHKDWFNLDPNKLYVSIFEGDEDAPFDQEAANAWKKEFKKVGMEALIFGKDKKTKKGEYRIFPLAKEDNWWGPAGETGPCGPDTEIFYYIKKGTPDIEKERPGMNDDNFIEIWNNVFMEFNKVKNADNDYSFEPLQSKNVDTGMGLERITSIMQGLRDNYKTDLFLPIVKAVERIIDFKYENDPIVDRSIRIISDHIRASVFLVGDGVIPSNVDQGYILRRLIRRAIRHIRSVKKQINKEYNYKLGEIRPITIAVIENYEKAYPNLKKDREKIISEINKEERKFSQTLEKGLKKLNDIIRKEEADNGVINGRIAFDLYQTYGFPIEMTEEIAAENEMQIDKKGFQKKLQAHKKLSRKGAEKKFKGGLSDQKENTIALHTAAHLLLAGLRNVLNEKVMQKGSNINEERLRFDFSYDKKMTDEEIKKVERYVNEAVNKCIEVNVEEMSLEEAKSKGAFGMFEDRYGDKVKVYTIKNYSKEICGGPHVKNTETLGKFKIVKEQSSSAGVRRIKAILEKE